MIETEEGEPIFNATIEVYQLVNTVQQYIDHDVTSSRSSASVDHLLRIHSH